MAGNNTYDFSILRSLRKMQGCTIAQVTETSGISAAVISRIERNHVVPELDTLARLAKVFGMSATDLLGLTESRAAQVASGQEYKSGGFEFKNVNFRNVQLFHAQGPAGATASRPEVHHNDMEVCWVISGSIELTVGPDIYVLKAGEAVQFDAMLKHEYRAVTATELFTLHIHKGARV